MTLFKHVIALGLFAASAFAQCGGSSGNLTFTCDSLGLTTLTYQGIDYLDKGGWARALPVTYGAIFADGTAAANSPRTAVSGSSYSQMTISPNATHAYRIRSDYSISDASTLKITFTISNLSSVSAIQSFRSLVPVSLSIPKPYTTVSDGGGQALDGSVGSLVVTRLASIAYYSTNYSDNWFAQRVGVYVNQPDAAHDRWNLGVNNVQNNGPVQFNTPIPPLSSKSLDLYVRFGPPDADHVQMQADSLAALRAAYPAQLSWPDRRPIATWFLSDYGHGSATNPRGWFNDPTCNCTNQATFHNRVQFVLNQVLGVLNSQPVRPQAVVLWDLEGQEYPQVMTYVGNPPLLNALAPEMDAEADLVMATLQANGYRVGMTLRPNRIVAGSPLPATCKYNANSDYTERFLLTDGIPRSRYYLCRSDGTYVNYGGIGSQLSYSDVASVVNEIANKVTYAKKRWGATVFYVDSAVWSGGAAFTSDIWRQLQARFPDCLFMPEQKTDRHYAYSAPYSDAHQGSFWSSGSHRSLYPGAFAAINLGNTSPAELSAGFASTAGQIVTRISGPGFVTTGAWSGQTVYVAGLPYSITSVTSANQLKLATAPPAQSRTTWRLGSLTDCVKFGMNTGDIYMYPGWFPTWQQDAVAAILTEAGYTTVVTDSSTGAVRSIGSAPGPAYRVPLNMTAAFAANTAGLAASTVTCAGGAPCTVNVKALPYYQLRYTDQTGKLVALGAALHF